MANKIGQTNLKPTDGYVNKFSRYANSDIIYYSDRNLLTFTTYKKNNIPVTTQDKYMVINPMYQYRPDRISTAVYGIPDFWWKILEANNLKDIFEFKTGLNIKLPGNIYF